MFAHRVKIFGLVTIFALVAFHGTHSMAAVGKVGTVDIQKVLDTVEQGKVAKADFEKELQVQKKKLDEKQAEFRKMEADYEKQKMVLSPQALEKRRAEMDEKRMGMQKFMLETQQKMQKREMELSGTILQRIRTIVEQIGRDGGYDFIWEKNEGGIVYSKSAFDVTDQVIKTYDKTHKK